MRDHTQSSNIPSGEWLGSFREALFSGLGGTGRPKRGALAFLMGAMAALLLLMSGAMELRHVAWCFAGALWMIVLGAIAARPFQRWNEFHWGALTLVVVGFGAGGLAYQSQDVVKQLWSRLLPLAQADTAHKMLAAFFLLGVILGFFVVRNWKQEQENFLKSMAAALGGAFATLITPKLLDDKLTPQYFALYALGFTLSGAVNLLVFAVLSASYTVRRSQASRTLVEVLYGHDLAGALDKHFEENFQQDPIFSRRMLIHSMELHRLHLLKELARSFSVRRWQLPAAVEGQGELAFFQLLSIQRTKQEQSAPSSVQYELLVEQVSTAIDKRMFRMNVAMKRGDMLDVVVPPDKKEAPFVYSGSVAGLALTAQEPIVMDRDKEKMFRVGDHESTPADLYQPRGEQVDYLSYVSIPLLGEVGDNSTLGHGVVNIDTRLFLSSMETLKGRGWEKVPGAPQWTHSCKDSEALKAEITALREEAIALYKDPALVPWLREQVEPLAPLLALYLKCDVGVQ